MDISHSYSNLLSYANILLARNPSQLLPEDLINEAYLKLYNEKFNLEKFKLEMRDYLYSQNRESLSNVAGNCIVKKPIKLSVSTKYCKKCDTDLPENSFRLRTDGKVQYLESYCKECSRKLNTERYNKNKKTIVKKLKPVIDTSVKKTRIKTGGRKKMFTNEEQRLKWNAYMRKCRSEGKYKPKKKEKIYQKIWEDIVNGVHSQYQKIF